MPDHSNLSPKERALRLLSQMTLDEKFSFLATTTPAIPRLNIRKQMIGGEASHGIVERHDQFDIREPEITTSFPQPFGMSQTFDESIMQEAGKAAGIEGRTIYNRKKEGGLFRWAPTVDAVRDPRWGRCEEGYGEDPFLIGKMAGAYVKGMQGDDPDHLQLSCALKHFFANNIEKDRAVISSSIDLKNRKEYYYEPFRRVIEDSGATSVMTSYNAVNGVTQMLDSRVRHLIKENWGLNGFVVCDGGAMSLVKNMRHETASHAQTIAASLKAGVDCITDDPSLVEEGVREAYDRGLITLYDIDQALLQSLTMKFRLGVFDDPCSHPNFSSREDLVCGKEHDALSLLLAEESLVLLKNNGLLPLAKNSDIALVGPSSNLWYQDWYGGIPPYRSTVYQALFRYLKHDIDWDNGLDRVLLCFDQQFLTLDKNGTASFTNVKEDADVFFLQRWDNHSVTFLSEQLDLYLSLQDDNTLKASKHVPFGWFCKELFFIENDHLFSWNHKPLFSDSSATSSPHFSLLCISSGKDRAIELAKRHDIILFAGGSCPVINAKEEIDRADLSFPEEQKSLLRAITNVNSNAVFLLLTNYPYAIDEEHEMAASILLSATGSQDMGNALVRAIYGEYNPAGRTCMTWYSKNTALPDIQDYDIYKTHRTYQYLTERPLYPFGYGLSYTAFAYGNIKLDSDSGPISIDSRPSMYYADMPDQWSFIDFQIPVTNNGYASGDEVVQIYVTKNIEGERPLHRLVGFERVRNISPGETRNVTICVPKKELRIFDTHSDRFVFLSGEYHFSIGSSSADSRQSICIFCSGEKIKHYPANVFLSIDRFSDYDHIVLSKGPAADTLCIAEDARICLEAGHESTSAVCRPNEAFGTIIFHSLPSFRSIDFFLASNGNGTLKYSLSSAEKPVVSDTVEVFSGISNGYQCFSCPVSERTDDCSLQITISGMIMLAGIRFVNEV